MDYSERWSGAPLSLSALAPSPGLRCELCGKTFRTSATYQAHCESLKHRAREAQADQHSPVKKSPTSKSGTSTSNAQIKAALNTPGARGAQALYDIGLEFARTGRGMEAQKCLAQCIQQLPPISSSMGRVMIEFKARLILSRIAWSTSQTEAQTQLMAAMSTMSQSGHPPPVSAFEAVPSLAELDILATEWRASLRLPDLWTSFVAVGREFGARLNAKQVSFPGAALLWIAGSYDFASAAFGGMELFGHLQEALLRAGMLEACLDACIAHPNPALQRRLAVAAVGTNALEVRDLALAATAWDLDRLDALSFSPDWSEVNRSRARNAVRLLSSAGFIS